MAENKNEITKMFNKIVNEEIKKPKDDNEFIRILNNRMDGLIDDKKQNIKVIGKIMINRSKILVNELK